MKSKIKTKVEILILGEHNTGIIIDGENCLAGDIESVDPSVAKNLIHRKRAVEYTEEVKKVLEEKLATEVKMNKANKDDPGEAGKGK